MAKKEKRSLFSKVFPKWALKRQIAQARLERLESFRKLDSVSGGRSRFGIGATSQDIDSTVADNIADLREQIRKFELENGNISGAFQRLKKNVVGHGIKLNAEIVSDDIVPKISEKQAETTNLLSEKFFNLWNLQADKRLIQHFYGTKGIQGIVEHTLAREGEALIVGRISRKKNRLIPYCLEVLETDRLDTPPEEVANPLVQNGIEFDSEGAPKYYYVMKEHPGNTISIKNQDYEQIPAYFDNGLKKVLFLYSPMRPEQTRAISPLTSGLKDIQDADRYMEAEKLAALEDACLFGTVTTDDVVGFDSNANETSGETDYERIHEFSPNEIKYLFPGEKLDVHRPERPGTQFEHFLNQVWRGPANSLDIPPEVMMQNWQGMNYSNARTVLLQFYATCRERQEYLKDYFCRPVYENVFNWFVIKGLIQAPSYYRRKHDWLNHSWIAPGWSWIDPMKEAQGKEIELDIGTENLSDVMLSQGADPRIKLEKRAKEKKYIKDLEKKYGVEMFPVKQPKPEMQNQNKDKPNE